MPFNFEAYCALCGVTLDPVNCRIHDTHQSREYRAVRARVLEERNRAALKVKESHLDEDSDSEDSDAEGTDTEDTDSGEGGTEEPSPDNGDVEDDQGNLAGVYIEDWDEDELEHCYDRRLLKHERMRWLGEVCALGVRSKGDKETEEYVLIRPVCAEENGGIEVHNHAELAVFRGRTMNCYDSLGDPEPPVYPFHEVCYGMFAKFLADQRGTESVDLRRLYAGMRPLTQQFATCLSLDYGTVTGRDQKWMAVPGEESSVSCPMGGMTNLMGEMEAFAKLSSSTTSRTRFAIPPTNADVFAKLPNEIIFQVLSYLPLDAHRALLAASWTAYTSASGRGFWARYMRRSMPWFLEIDSTLDQPWAAEIDLKALCYWLESKTRFNVNMTAPFLRMANRRRIWGVCEQLADVYNDMGWDASQIPRSRLRLVGQEWVPGS